jgi:hypothetical protein
VARGQHVQRWTSPRDAYPEVRQTAVWSLCNHTCAHVGMSAACCQSQSVNRDAGPEMGVRQPPEADQHLRWHATTGHGVWCSLVCSGVTYLPQSLHPSGANAHVRAVESGAAVLLFPPRQGLDQHRGGSPTQAQHVLSVPRAGDGAGAPRIGFSEPSSPARVPEVAMQVTRLQRVCTTVMHCNTCTLPASGPCRAPKP